MKILLVDDHRDSVRVNQLVLELSGDEVVVAFDGASGLEAAHAAAPEAVVLDLHMPGVDGYETCRRMRALPALRAAPIIALTGSSGDDEVVRRA